MSALITQESSNAIAAAVQWISATLSGTVATTVAVIAIASIGLLMLSGRVDMRRTVQVVIGCFILFGASSIAAGIMRSLNADGAAQPMVGPPPAPAYPLPDARPPAADPYAGAAVPPRG